ncbi:MAG: hypothetical protein PHY02_11090 [Phycisphaerae bacterium]|nr:hypothetical protein [Phycisphaerae bacterium]
MMDSREIETLAELISIKTAEKYMEITKQYIQKEIALHEANCTVKKDARTKTTVSNVITGIVVGAIVAVVDWFIKK